MRVALHPRPSIKLQLLLQTKLDKLKTRERNKILNYFNQQEAFFHLSILLC